MRHPFPGQVVKKSLLILSLFLGVLPGCSKNPVELQKEFMAKGQHYLSEGKTNEAVIEFQNLLKVNPRSPKGRYWLGKAYLKKGWTTDSILQFQEAVKEDPLLLPAHVAVAQYAVNSGQWTAAKPEIAAILKIDPNNADGWALSGQRALAMGREAEAQKDLDRALALKPGMAPALVALGDMKRHQNHPEEAKEFYHKALDKDSANTRAWTGLGFLAQGFKKSDEAETDFKKAVKVDPSDLRSRIVLANFMAQQGHLRAAILSLKSIPAKAADLRVPIKIAEYETLLGENTKAIRILNPLERQKIQIPDIYFVLAKAYQQSGRGQDALDMVDKLLSLGGIPPFMKISAARIAFSEGKPEETEKILSSLQNLPNLPIIYWLTEANVALALRQPDESKTLIAKALKSFPDDPRLFLTMADAQAQEKQFGEARRTLERELAAHPLDQAAIFRMAALLNKTQGPGTEISYLHGFSEKHPNQPAFETLYVLALASNKKLPAAIRESKSYLGAHPGNQNIRLLLAEFYLRAGRQKKATDALKAILSADPKNLSAINILGDLDLRSGHYADAESFYRRSILISPENANLYDSLGKTLLAENQQSAAKTAFLKSLSFNPNQPDALLNVARAEIISGQSQRALTHLTPLVRAQEPNPFMAEVQWLWGLAHENNGDLDTAGGAFKKAVKLDPKNPAYHESLGDYWSATGQFDKSLSEFDKSLALRSDNPLLVIKKDWVKISMKKGKPETTLVKDLVERALAYHTSHPDNIPVLLVAAQGNLVLKKPEVALSLYDRILSKNSDNPMALLGKAALLLNQKHVKQARKVVDKLLINHPDNVQGNLILAGLDQRDNNLRGAADHFGKIHQLHPEWINPALSLVSTDLALGRFSEAKSIAFSIHEAHPDLGLALFFQASAEMGLKDYRKALRDFKPLVKKEKNPAGLYLSMSVASMGLGDREGQRQYLELAVRSAPNDPAVLNNMAFFMADDKAKISKALSYAQKALKLNPSPVIQDTVGFILFKMGNYSGAEPYFRTAYAAHFRDPEFLFHMGLNEAKLGKTDQASDLLKKAVISGNLTPEDQKMAHRTLRKLGA